MGRIRRLFLGGLWGPDVDDAVEWEIRHHVEERIDELMEAGLSREEAEEEAERAFGDMERVRREMRSLSRGRRRRERLRRGLEAVGQDLRHALRRLRKSPGFAAVVILVLGLGIGANATLFTALEAALLKDAPYPEAERLVVVDLLLASSADEPRDTMSWSYPKFEAARASIGSVEAMAGYAARTGTLTGDGRAVRIGFEYVSPVYFELLGVRPVVGRVFGEAEEEPGSAAVALLGHGIWRSRYGGDPDVVGRTITLNGASLEVEGVLPAGFDGLSGAAEVWVPLAGAATIRSPRRLEMVWAHWFNVLGRLSPGVSMERAREEAAATGRALTERFPDPSGGGTHGVTMVPLLKARVNPVARLAIAAVATGAVLLLLVACANVGGLLLARAVARRGEVAVRAALGAARSRLIRESILESLLLAGAGGTVALGLAAAGHRIVRWGVRYALDTSGARGLRFLDPDALAVDGTVLAVALALAVVTGLLFGILPARVAARVELTEDLRSATPGSVGRRRDWPEFARGLLVAGQLALTLVLLAGAGVVGASFARLSAVDTGFTNENVLTLRFDRGPGSSADENRRFEATLLERLAALPGVEAAAVAPCAPLAGRCEIAGLRRLDDQPPASWEDMPGILTYAVSHGYFDALGVPLVEGRAFRASDGAGARPVVVINEAAAREHFPGGSAIGHRLAITHALTEDRMAEVVGVVRDVPYADLEEPAMPAVYLSRRQAPTSYGTIFLSTAGDPMAWVDEARTAVATLDAELPLYDVTTMAERKAVATARTRIVLGLLTAFGIMGLVLSAIGLYGVVSYAVVRRTREIGLRVALGASTRGVLRLLLTPPAALAVAGVALGVVGAIGLTRYAEGLLFGVEPSDPRVLAAASVVLLCVAVTAAWVPARRATRLEPTDALSAE